MGGRCAAGSMSSRNLPKTGCPVSSGRGGGVDQLQLLLQLGDALLVVADGGHGAAAVIGHFQRADAVVHLRDALSPRVGVDKALDAVAAAVDLGCQVGGGGGSHIHAASSSVAMRGRRRLSRTSPRPASSLVMRASANCWWACRTGLARRSLAVMSSSSWISVADRAAAWVACSLAASSSCRRPYSAWAAAAVLRVSCSRLLSWRNWRW